MFQSIKSDLFLTLLCLTLILTGCKGEAYASGVLGSQPAQITAVSAAPIEFIDGVALITKGGRYRISGEHTGQILINATRSDEVEIILDGVILNNPAGQAIFAPRSKSVELILADGTVNYISDGIHSDTENNAAIFVQHDLVISGNGTLNVTGNFHHGIRAQDFLVISGGTINITAAGDALRGRDGVIIQDGEFNLIAGGDGIQSNNDSNPDYGFITINGGTFNISAGDDGMQAETSITIYNGSLTIKAADDGITTGGSVLIAGGYINITESYEGIEGLNVTITGGIVNVYARDDGINARDSELTGMNNMRGGWQMMRGPANQNMYVRITGGIINIHALRDGIDSNNNIFLEGGSLSISGQSMGMEGAIDLDGVFLLTGGELITAGSVMNVSGQSTQPILYVTFNQQLPAGTSIDIRDENEKILLSYTALMAFRVSAFTSPEFKIGKTYSLYVNDQKASDAALGSIITSLGGSNNYMGGGRGNMGGGISPGDFERGSRGNPGSLPELPNPQDFRVFPGTPVPGTPVPEMLPPGNYGRSTDRMPRL